MRIQNIFAPSDKHQQRGASFFVWFRVVFFTRFFTSSCLLHFSFHPIGFPFYRISNETFIKFEEEKKMSRPWSHFDAKQRGRNLDKRLSTVKMAWEPEKQLSEFLLLEFCEFWLSEKELSRFVRPCNASKSFPIERSFQELMN